MHGEDTRTPTPALPTLAPCTRSLTEIYWTENTHLIHVSRKNGPGHAQAGVGARGWRESEKPRRTTRASRRPQEVAHEVEGGWDVRRRAREG